MPTSYPDALDAFVNPGASDNLDSITVPHATQHANINDAVEAVEAELGLLPSSGFPSIRARLDWVAPVDDQANLPLTLQAKVATDVSNTGSTIGAAVASRITAQAAADVAAAIAAAGTVVSAAASAATTAVNAAVPSAVQSYLAAGSVGQFRYTGFAWYDGDAATPDAYHALGGLGQDAGALSGNTGYTRQTTGVPVDAQVQSRMRRCALKNDGSGVQYYLDCDDSTKVAGLYSAGVQTGWVRVHEGVNDPVRPVFGQATTGNATLRAGIPAWTTTAVYAKGDRVTSGGFLWDCLNDGSTNITPAAGTVASVLDGTDGQIMVEIPRFYYAESYDPVAGRLIMAVACDIDQLRPFPNMAVASTAATSIVVGGRTYAVHPAFTKGASQRPARYIAAYRATATDTGNNGTGTLLSKADGSTVYAGTVSRTNFRTKARNRNTGLSDPSSEINNVWNLLDYQLWHAVQVLFLTEYRTFYAQAVIGGGNNGGSDYQKIAGRSNPLGNATGNYNSSGALIAVTTGDTDGVAYRGIEDLYGSQWLWVDGDNVQNTASGIDFYTCNNPHQFADGTATNYVKVATAPNTAAGWAYAKTWVPGTLIPAKVGGSSTTYSTDGYISAAATSGWYAVFVGGAAGYGAGGGVVALFVYSTASGAGADIGAALAR